MNRIRSLIPSRGKLVGAAAFVAAALIFQNCAGYAPTPTDTSSADATAAAAASGLCDPTAADCSGTLSLKVRSNNNTWVVAADQTAFDMGGDCDASSFPTSRVRWSLTNAGGSTIASGALAAGCDDVGRWRVYVAIPSGTPRAGAQYTFNATLTAIDPISGMEIYNSVGSGAQSIPVTIN